MILNKYEKIQFNFRVGTTLLFIKVIALKQFKKLKVLNMWIHIVLCLEMCMNQMLPMCKWNFSKLSTVHLSLTTFFKVWNILRELSRICHELIKILRKSWAIEASQRRPPAVSKKAIKLLLKFLDIQQISHKS